MPYLLDTCTLIWYFEGSESMPEGVRDQLTDPQNEVYMSDVSILEVVIKYMAGKFPLSAPPSRFLPTLAEKHMLAALPLLQEAIFRMESLPPLHRDPFDRLLIAQSLEHGLTLVTPDPKIRQYNLSTLWD
ncbi:MAG: type II toxin-antitoxin system VapC family toxin [Spirochaetaceae bacterium]|nr:MAG: type II toxin-antitoxin system VapC family toxin [Spirochaetaceae bacterium]